MSTSLDLTKVTASIAALNILNVTVRELYDMTDSMLMSDHTLAPRATNFVTNFKVKRDECTAQLLRVSYTLNYVYYHCQVGSGLGGLYADFYPLMEAVEKILLAFSNDVTLTGAVDNQEPTVGAIGTVNDPAGNRYHGCAVSINIEQFLEV